MSRPYRYKPRSSAAVRAAYAEGDLEAEYVSGAKTFTGRSALKKSCSTKARHALHPGQGRFAAGSSEDQADLDTIDSGCDELVESQQYNPLDTYEAVGAQLGLGASDYYRRGYRSPVYRTRYRNAYPYRGNYRTGYSGASRRRFSM